LLLVVIMNITCNILLVSIWKFMILLLGELS